MGYADLHIHTIHSYDGTSTVSAILKYISNKTDLDVIAITDHNTMTGVQEALDMAPAYGIEVIPGCEISTNDGHLLGLYIHKPIQAGLSLLRTIQLVGEQGGICIAAHPMAKGTQSLDFVTIHKALQIPGMNEILIGIEAFNGGLVYTRRNHLVEGLAQTFPLSQVGNSDAHILESIGQGSSEFPGSTAVELRAALVNGTTHVRKGKGLDGLTVICNYIPRYLLRNMGWVVSHAKPENLSPIPGYHP